jgi:hypothetical protein
MTAIELYHKAGKVSKKKCVAVISIVLGHTTTTVPGLKISGSYTSNPPHAFMVSREKTSPFVWTAQSVSTVGSAG